MIVQAFREYFKQSTQISVADVFTYGQDAFFFHTVEEPGYGFRTGRVVLPHRGHADVLRSQSDTFYAGQEGRLLRDKGASLIDQRLC